MLRELLNKKINIEKQLIDTHKCRFMGVINTYEITLREKDNFKYPKAVLNKGIGGSSILPVDKEGNVYLEIQYRFPIREAIIEVPAGRIDEGESFFDCAKRELREETGCISDKIISQIELYAQPEFTNERLGSFLAVDCEQIYEQDLDNDESVCVFKVPYEIAVELIKRNLIKDERTIIAIGISRCIQGLSFSKGNQNMDFLEENIKKKIEDEAKELEEREIDIDYTIPCEFGVVQDHIVVVPGNKNSRRECFYLKSGNIVLPISKEGKIGFFVRYMPSVDKNLIQLPTKVELPDNTDIYEFGEMVTAVGYSNDRQYMFLASDMEETDDFVWLSVEEVKLYIKDGLIEDGRVLAILLKYLVGIER